MKLSECPYLELLYLFVFLKIGKISEQMENGFRNSYCVDFTTSPIHPNQSASVKRTWELLIPGPLQIDRLSWCFPPNPDQVQPGLVF